MQLSQLKQDYQYGKLSAQEYMIELESMLTQTDSNELLDSILKELLRIDGIQNGVTL